MVSLSLKDIEKAIPQSKRPRVPKAPQRERDARQPVAPCRTCGHRPCTCLMDSLCGQLHQAGHPLPVREYLFAAPARRWRLDGAYISIMVGIECDGGTWNQGRHTRGYGFESDCEKLTTAAILGWMVLRFTTDMIADGRALTYVERALRVRGAPSEQPKPVQASFGYPTR